MKTFSLLQASLDQTIGREALEEASDAARSVARADCARLLRERSGILISRLPKDEAIAFQRELMGRNFPTDPVADHDLPVLHQSFQIQRIERREEVLLLTDSMDRERARPINELVFLAAGFMNRLKVKPEWNQHLEYTVNLSEGMDMPRVVTEMRLKEDTELEFRLDFFFCSGPNRLHVNLAMETAIFHHGKPLRLRDSAGLREFTDAMAKLLPRERLNAFLRDPDEHPFYPDLSCYENEIRWHFHRLKPRG